MARYRPARPAALGAVRTPWPGIDPDSADRRVDTLSPPRRSRPPALRSQLPGGSPIPYRLQASTSSHPRSHPRDRPHSNCVNLRSRVTPSPALGPTTPARSGRRCTSPNRLRCSWRRFYCSATGHIEMKWPWRGGQLGTYGRRGARRYFAVDDLRSRSPRSRPVAAMPPPRTHPRRPAATDTAVVFNRLRRDGVRRPVTRNEAGVVR